MARTVQVSMADVDLFHVAAAQLGDATLWHTIATLNGWSDPLIANNLHGQPVVTLAIPVPDPAQSGGIAQQS